MYRRAFIQKTFILGGLASGLSSFTPIKKSHIITLSFDDGFKKSFYRIAEIFEQFNLRACLNVIASGHLSSYKPPTHYMELETGNFDDWNLLKKRGHEIMPHSWDHSDLTHMPLEKAKEDITRCLDYFAEHLEGYDAAKAVYNFAYNASNPELEQYVLGKVVAVRSGGPTINPYPRTTSKFRLGCQSFGPENADPWLKQQISRFLAGSGGWLILNLHGLDEEGWGPVSSACLKDTLSQLSDLKHVEVLPTGEVIARVLKNDPTK
ncbi:MAG: polysaccharide deacetylase family protein [Mariniphaga sp.]|nr:polysaccharide deacetylase family protein [Mariniphaga sp.]